MSKPREFWIILHGSNDEPIYTPEEHAKYPEDFEHGEHYHVIEKSAADKLADALEFYADPQSWSSRTSGHGDSSTDVIKDDGGYMTPAAGMAARQALALYRGEK